MRRAPKLWRRRFIARFEQVVLHSLLNLPGGSPREVERENRQVKFNSLRQRSGPINHSSDTIGFTRVNEHVADMKSKCTTSEPTS